MIRKEMSNWGLIVTILNSIFIWYLAPYGSSITVYEALMIICSDRLMLSTIITLPILFLNAKTLCPTRDQSQLLLKIGNIKKWFWLNNIVSCLRVFLYLIILCTSLVICALFLGIQFQDVWSEFAIFGKINIIDGFDYTGSPFSILISENMSASLALALALLLLLFRCLFYSELQRLFVLCFNRRLFAQMLAILFNYCDAFFYSIVPIDQCGVLPHEHSIITSIANYRVPVAISYVYWLILIGGILGIQLCLADIYCETVLMDKQVGKHWGTL